VSSRKLKIKSKSEKKCESPIAAMVATIISLDGWLNNEQAAWYLQISPGTLEIYRSQGKGPKCSYICTRPRYKKSDLDAWANAGKPKQAAVAS
jgi:helix-turn-helix protein